MTSIAKENLDERIERIKKRNEEIEKKYREAEEDRLMALKDNAMVKTKPPKDEDWPKAHKYDKLDFTYDVKPEKLEESNKRKQEETKLKRDYKKFADGEGPPPDPAYNFLADAERDGIKNASHKNEINKKDSKQNNTDSKNNKIKDYQQQQKQHKRGGSNNNSFRGRGGNNNTSSKRYNSKISKQSSQTEYEQWRNEKEKIDDTWINRQKISYIDGKWKRNENDSLLKSERCITEVYNNLSSNSIGIRKSPTHNNQGIGKLTRQNSAGHNFISAVDCLVEKRANITVSVSHTGEVKSVKLTSAPPIGTGRVGPRQISKPQFSIQKIEREEEAAQLHSPLSPNLQTKNSVKNTLSSFKNISNSTINNNSANINNLTQRIATNKNVTFSEKNTLIITPPLSIKNKKDKKHSSKQPIVNGNQQSQPVPILGAGAGNSQLIKISGIANNQQSIASNNVNFQVQQQQQVQGLVSKKIQQSCIQCIQSVVQKPIHQHQQILEKVHPELGSIEPNNSNHLHSISSTDESSSSTSAPTKNTLPEPVFDDINSAATTISPDLKTSETPLSQPLSANEIIPVVDLSHKPEFAKKSIQDRLLRVRQTNQSNNITLTTNNTLINNNNSNSDSNLNPVTLNENTNINNNNETEQSSHSTSSTLDDHKIHEKIKSEIILNPTKISSTVEKMTEVEEIIKSVVIANQTAIAENKNDIRVFETSEAINENIPTATETAVACN